MTFSVNYTFKMTVWTKIGLETKNRLNYTLVKPRIETREEVKV